MAIRFELGQRLWPIQRLINKWYVNPPFDLQFIMVKGCDTLFSFTSDYGFIECDIFATEAEATVECNRRNAPPARAPDVAEEK